MHHWVILHKLFHLRFDENASQRLHIFVLLITLVFVWVELFSEEYIPIFSVLATFLLFLDDLAFNMNRVLSITMITGFGFISFWKSTDTIRDDLSSSFTSWTELISNTTTTLDEWFVCLVFEIIVSHAVHRWWRKRSFKFQLSTRTQAVHWLQELLTLLDIVALEIRHRNRIACNIFIHNQVIIASSWLFNRLWNMLRNNLVLHRRNIRLFWSFIRLGIVEKLLLILYLLQLLLKSKSLLIDCVVHFLLVFCDLVQDVLGVYLILDLEFVFGLLLLLCLWWTWTTSVLTEETSLVVEVGVISSNGSVWTKCSNVSHFRWCNSFHRLHRPRQHRLPIARSHRLFVSPTSKLILIVFILLHHFQIQIVISLVSPKVFRTWQSFSEKTHQCQNGITWDFFIHFLKLSRINSLFSFETHF